MKTIINTVALLLASLTTAFASSEHAAAHVDTSLTYNSGILVLAFAGFLALVVVVQLVPALVSLYGMIKNASEAARNKEVEANVTSK